MPRAQGCARAATFKSRRLRLALPMTILGKIGLTDARETFRRKQRQPLPGDRVGYDDRTVSVPAPTDETPFEFQRKLEKTADRFPADTPAIETTLRTSKTRTQEVYR